MHRAATYRDVSQSKASEHLFVPGDTDALAALNGCLRSQEGLTWVAQWAVDFLAQALGFLIGAME